MAIEKAIFFGKAPSKNGRRRVPTRWTDVIRARMSSVVGATSEAQLVDQISKIEVKKKLNF